MRHRKSEPRPAGELRALNARELIFVESLGQGDSNIAAYRRAYGAEGYSEPALLVEACRKAAAPHIRAHLRSLRAAGFASARLRLEDRVIAELAFAQRCEDAGNYGAAGGAFDRVNKMLGLYVERSEVVVSVDPQVTLKELASMIGEDSLEVRH
jgi:hypothetical protein